MSVYFYKSGWRKSVNFSGQTGDFPVLKPLTRCQTFPITIVTSTLKYSFHLEKILETSLMYARLFPNIKKSISAGLTTE